MPAISRWQLLVATVLILGALWLLLPTFLGVERAARYDWMPQRSINLGLDLRGGSYLLLEVDFDSYMREQQANLRDEVRRALLEGKLRYQSFRAEGSRVVVRIPDIDSQREAIDAALERFGADIDYGIADGTLHVSYTDAAQARMKQNVLDQSIEIVNRRIDETGTREPIIQRQGGDRILVQVPGLDNPERLKRLLGRTAKMTFHLVDVTVSPVALASGDVPAGTRVLYGAENRRDPSEVQRRYAVQSRVMLSGDQLVDAQASFDERGRPAVGFRFNTFGAKKFGAITQENRGKPFAIVLDNRVITAPEIQEPILNGSGIITGYFTVESANDLALLLRAGALPAPLNVIEERSVGPSLGADSIAAGKDASILALALVILFIVVVYGPLGLVASVALLVNMLLLLAALALLQATLTLPGIAGIVLTLGMAVDANVLIFERMYEETRMGKSPPAAIDQGFRAATTTIVDANLTTLIAAVLLYYFGTGSVKGFAVTLSLGIITSMYTAIFLARIIITQWWRWKKPKALPF